ncbi:MAG: peptide chain release factor N(5)-glutamine methyltransferase [Thermoleophilia bacterium]|nr:peptide chain release factor N(5)-glutamine methyltransferase [Thermoleophilia bacterium]
MPADPWTIGTLLETAAGYLRGKGSTSPRLDAELLLAETLGLERIHLYMQFDRPLATGEVDGFRALIARRAAHEPVAYILGQAHFRRLRLEVTPAVLIPRPETEELVDIALDSLRRRPAWAPATPNGTPLVADLGTGSGAIALSLAQEAGVAVLAIDSDAEALEVAARNGAATGLERLVRLEQADLLSTVAARSLHLIVSNPPYVTSGDMATLAPDIRLFEPAAALDAGPDGLAVIQRLLPQAARALRPGGAVLLEVGDGQAASVVALAREAGFSLIAVHKDLSQKDRIVEAVLPGAVTMAPEDLDGTRRGALVGALEAGAVLGIPTDTVYGIAARWDSQAGVRRLFAAKGRSPEQPVAVLFASVGAIEEALPDLEPSCLEVLRALLPGPFTFIVATGVPRPALVGTADSLGVRVPDHSAVLGLLSSLDTPLAATSANLTGGADPARLAEVDPQVLAHCSIAFAADGDQAAAGSASTVVDLRPLASGADPLIVREGVVPAAAVLERIATLG